LDENQVFSTFWRGVLDHIFEYIVASGDDHWTSLWLAWERFTSTDNHIALDTHLSERLADPTATDDDGWSDILASVLHWLKRKVSIYHNDARRSRDCRVEDRSNRVLHVPS